LPPQFSLPRRPFRRAAYTKKKAARADPEPIKWPSCEWPGLKHCEWPGCEEAALTFRAGTAKHFVPARQGDLLAQGRRILLILCARHSGAARESEERFYLPLAPCVLSAEERAESFYLRELPADKEALVRWAKAARRLGIRPEDSKSYLEDYDARTRIEREPRRGERRPWRPSLMFIARRKGYSSPGEPAADVLILARQLSSPGPKFLAYLEDWLGAETVNDWIRELEGERKRNPRSGKLNWRGGVPGLKRRLRLASKGHDAQGRPRGSRDGQPRTRRAPDAELYAEFDAAFQKAREEERDCAMKENRPPRSRGVRKHVLIEFTLLRVNAIESDPTFLRGYYRWLARQQAN
jgi:hypothetical protein